ncbi:hypothetical protein [Aureimonas sp. AU22]|jgi:hypothetical protein|uniref:hypothetical protein n=1 Tax=Aureimonas sp. AU22 TaxID=1638162 RepID=UPI000780BDB2|nr:hypothetical protein [Aureimonas sp. AU22]
MTDYFDWLTATDAGVLADRLANQFRLSQEEMRRTTDALVPAFMLGFQRSMLDPDAWGRLLRGFAPALPFGPSASLPPHEAGEAFVRTLFGPELAGAVVRQASLLSGQAPDVIEKMMPALGLLSFQSMLQTMAAFTRQAPGAYPSDPAGQAMAEAMRRSANALEAFSRPADAPRSSTQAMTDLFAGALRGWPWMNGPAATAVDPMALMTAWTTGWMRSATPAPAPQRAPEPAPAGRDAQPPAPFAFAGMLANAQSLQAEYMREMLSVFERHGAGPRSPKA